MNVFTYDNGNNRIEINEPEILLIKEFKALSDRDKTKNKTRLWKELTYIYLAIDWKSLYNQYSEQERHMEALSDSGITEEEFNLAVNSLKDSLSQHDDTADSLYSSYIGQFDHLEASKESTYASQIPEKPEDSNEGTMPSEGQKPISSDGSITLRCLFDSRTNP